MHPVEMIYNVLCLAVPFSVAILLAALGENFNQRAGIFNLGCDGIMCVGAFLGFMVPYSIKAGALLPYGNVLGVLAAMTGGALLGLLFALVTVTFRASQGIAGIGLQMLGWGLSGTLFRHFVGGVTGVEGIHVYAIPGLSHLPFLGGVLFSHTPLAYLAVLMVPISWFLVY